MKVSLKVCMKVCNMRAQYGIYWVSWYLCNPAVLDPSSLGVVATFSVYFKRYGCYISPPKMGPRRGRQPSSLRICEKPNVQNLIFLVLLIINLQKATANEFESAMNVFQSSVEISRRPTLKDILEAKCLCQQKRIYFKKTCNKCSFVQFLVI